MYYIRFSAFWLVSFRWSVVAPLVFTGNNQITVKKLLIGCSIRMYQYHGAKEIALVSDFFYAIICIPLLWIVNNWICSIVLWMGNK